jgi:LPS-assembly lipoprotein
LWYSSKVKPIDNHKQTPHRPVAAWCWIGFSLLVLNGCGFHLRGSVLLPADVNTVYLQVANADLAEEIKLLLEAGEASIVPTGEDADLTLIVTPERLERQLLAVDPKTGKAVEFELTYATSYEVLDKERQSLMPTQSLSLSRDLVFDPEAVIGSSREEEVIYMEMRRDAARQIMARMQATLNP